MVSDECRPVEIDVDGRKQTIRVHGGEPMSPQATEAMSELVAAARAKMAAEYTVKQRALAVLNDHRQAYPAGCQCGAISINSLWPVHVLRMLDRAGVLRPMNERLGGGGG